MAMRPAAAGALAGRRVPACRNRRAHLIVDVKCSDDPEALVFPVVAGRLPVSVCRTGSVGSVGERAAAQHAPGLLGAAPGIDGLGETRVGCWVVFPRAGVRWELGLGRAVVSRWAVL